MFFSFLSRYKDIALLVARIGIGSSYIIVHGWKKVTGGPQRWESLGGAMKNLGIDFFPVFWGFMAAFAETAGGLLVVIGLFFRPASALILFTMCVAALRHIANNDPLARIAYPIEMSMVLVLFLFIGAGKYSLDYRFWRK
jgi:putative oxidoreductase